MQNEERQTTVTPQQITCKSALTGSEGHYRLNPYVGCTHACAYCYATYLAHWRGQSGPWGSWVQAKTNIPRVLERELLRKRGIQVFLSTACDVYQPAEEQLRLTRHCLSILAIAAQKDDDLSVFLLTKSDLILRDIDVLQAFPAGRIGMGFSLTTHRDDVAAILEPGASSPSRRIEAARKLREAGLRVELFANPILPYVTERDLPGLADCAAKIGVRLGGFGLVHYLERHVGGKLRAAYRHFGPEALARLKAAQQDPGYEAQVRRLVAEVTEAAG
jgi:DNA repair photolyase